MYEKTKELKTIDLIPSGGVNEISAVTAVPITSFLQMINWRVSRDGIRIEKRGGLSQVAQITGSKPIYGYTTYYDVSLNFCQLAITEDKIWRKIGSGSWTSIHTWSSSLAHPIKIHEIQRKIYILTEIENKMILSNGTLVQCGISPPTTIPTLTAAYEATLLDEDFADISDWNDEDGGVGASTQVTFDSKSCLKQLNTGATGDFCKVSRTVSDTGPELTIEFDAYLDLLGIVSDENYFQFNIYNGRILAQIRIDKNDVYVYSGESWVSCGTTINQDTWINFKIYINSMTSGEEYCEIYKDNVSIGHFNCANPNEATAGKTEICLYGKSLATLCYFDFIKIGTNNGGNLNGIYRFAIAYRRSGNYGEVSNPIKSKIGSVTFTGSGLNDMTTSGTYTGDKTRTIRVQIDSTGTPDTFKWSEDGGKTWNSSGQLLNALNYLSYGIEIKWAATTGHTLNEYWEFICYALSIVACHQKVTMSNIPVSSDPQVDYKDIYQTTPGGADYYLIAKIPNSMTSFVCNLPDAALGIDMKEDREIPPLGKYSLWWDDRLWIADEDENIVYYSDINSPEAFDSANRFVSVRMGESDDVITQMAVYKGYLYVFKRKSIYLIRKKGSGYYGRYEVCKDFGNIAPGSLIETFGLLTFISFRGLEVFNGCEGFSTLFSMPVDKTLKTIDKTKLEYIHSGHDLKYNEIWFSLPDRTGGNSAITLVCNYLKSQCFYFFEFHKIPSGFFECRDSSGDLQLYMGTRDGYLFLCDSGNQDGTTNITASARIPWLKFDRKFYFRNLDIEYECPTNKSLTFFYYRDMDKDSVRTHNFSGKTPTSTDQDIRLPIDDYDELAITAKTFSIKFFNNEAVGSDLKINYLRLYAAPRHKPKKISPD